MTDITTTLALGHSYLVKKWHNSTILKLTVLQITKTSLQIQWENGTKVWWLNGDVDCHIIEDLGIDNQNQSK